MLRCIPAGAVLFLDGWVDDGRCVSTSGKGGGVYIGLGLWSEAWLWVPEHQVRVYMRGVVQAFARVTEPSGAMLQSPAKRVATMT